MKDTRLNDSRFFKTPFSADYWRLSFAQIKSVKILVLAALFIALRLALKAIKIPVGDSLNIFVVFTANALGSMLCGPFVALLSGAICDTIGYLLAPSGPYFIGFMLVEALGSFLYAIFLYRARVTVVRLFLAKFTVSLVCNIILTPLFLQILYGKGILYYLVPRIIKNIALLPVETLLLFVVFSAILPIVKRMKIVPLQSDRVTYV